jgi:hypothetical protein
LVETVSLDGLSHSMVEYVKRKAETRLFATTLGAKESDSRLIRWLTRVVNSFGNSLCGWELVRPGCNLRGKGRASQWLGTRCRGRETPSFFDDKSNRMV